MKVENQAYDYIMYKNNYITTHHDYTCHQQSDGILHQLYCHCPLQVLLSSISSYYSLQKNIDVLSKEYFEMASLWNFLLTNLNQKTVHFHT